MPKFFVYGDSENKPLFSSNIIISNLNKALQRLGMYDESGLKVCYDGVCNKHGNEPDAFICTYEISFPKLVIDQAGGKPIIGVSRDNERFIKEGGYPEDKCGWFSLGVDFDQWHEIPKTKELDTFNFGVYTESLVRGGVEDVVECFGKAFSGRKDVKLKVKDRNGTGKFAKHVRDRADYYNINCDYYNDNWDIVQAREFFSTLDVHIYNNKSSTFALPCAQSLAASVPTIAVAYSGPRDYCNDFNSIITPHGLERIDNKLGQLLSIGLRNFFFLNGYIQHPVWAETHHDELVNNMIQCANGQKDLKSLRQNARNSISHLTWNNAALNLSRLLERWY